MAGDGSKGEWADELLGGACHDDVRVEARILQGPNQLHGLIGRDAASDSDRNLCAFLLLRHSPGLYSPLTRIIPMCLLVRVDTIGE